MGGQPWPELELHGPAMGKEGKAGGAPWRGLLWRGCRRHHGAAGPVWSAAVRENRKQEGEEEKEEREKKQKMKEKKRGKKEKIYGNF
jgi:hypothetical protein